MEQFWQKLTSLAFHRTLSGDNGEQASVERPEALLPENLHAFLQQVTGGPGNNPEIYLTAFTHRSVTHDPLTSSTQSNQRLEFLGDAVLDLVISEYLYRAFPESAEGDLSSNRSKIVNRKSLAGFALGMGLGKYLIIGESADKNKIRCSESALADAFESLTGAIYLDKGLDAARSFVMKQVIGHVDFKSIVASEHNYKSRLIEYTQSHHIPPPAYTVIAQEGAEHEKIFTIEVACDGIVCGRGTAPRKKDAEQLAAREALVTLLQAGQHPSPEA
ncbi:MAG: ribonuclease III [Chlorobium sp.]|uniref:ribonuclease III n=1 Tax=Chlorobium sp. TaxID=1095 RepID=UPI0025B8EA62|nr:ribonuclease III [Chlorobium sp.]MCF8383353.1 ribonuclease III [Chlorobium sp.]